MTQRIYIYALCREDGSVFYIGKTKNAVAARIQQHYAEAVAHRILSHHDQLILRLWDGCTIPHKIFAWTSDLRLADTIERYLIYTYPEPLTNIVHRPLIGRLENAQGLQPKAAYFPLTVQ